MVVNDEIYILESIINPKNLIVQCQLYFLQSHFVFVLKKLLMLESSFILFCRSREPVLLKMLHLDAVPSNSLIWIYAS